MWSLSGYKAGAFILKWGGQVWWLVGAVFLKALRFKSCSRQWGGGGRAMGSKQALPFCRLPSIDSKHWAQKSPSESNDVSNIANIYHISTGFRALWKGLMGTQLSKTQSPRQEIHSGPVGTDASCYRYSGCLSDSPRPKVLLPQTWGQERPEEEKETSPTWQANLLRL